MRERQRDEVWRRAKARMDKVAGPYKARALTEELWKQGLNVTEAIRRVVEEFLGTNTTEDQVRALAATWAWVLGVEVDRFVALWREYRSRR